jgi:hypothetical protein
METCGAVEEPRFASAMMLFRNPRSQTNHPFGGRRIEMAERMICPRIATGEEAADMPGV